MFVQLVRYFISGGVAFIADQKSGKAVYKDGETIIGYEGYTVSYNENLLIPNWVSYELTAEENLKER